MEAEVTGAMMDGSQPEVVVAAPEAAPHPVLPVAQETTPVVGKTEGVMAKGPSDIMVVAEQTGRELSLVLTPGGNHPPMQDEPLLRWVSPQDLSSELFTLDDAAEGMERDSLNEGIMAVLEALNQARGAL